MRKRGGGGSYRRQRRPPSAFSRPCVRASPVPLVPPSPFPRFAGSPLPSAHGSRHSALHLVSPSPCPRLSPFSLSPVLPLPLSACFPASCLLPPAPGTPTGSPPLRPGKSTQSTTFVVLPSPPRTAYRPRTAEQQLAKYQSLTPFIDPIYGLMPRLHAFLPDQLPLRLKGTRIAPGHPGEMRGREFHWPPVPFSV
jgi:hypothetical protein